jgi:hypothetical protein
VLAAAVTASSVLVCARLRRPSVKPAPPELKRPLCFSFFSWRSLWRSVAASMAMSPPAVSKVSLPETAEEPVRVRLRPAERETVSPETVLDSARVSETASKVLLFFVENPCSALGALQALRGFARFEARSRRLRGGAARLVIVAARA